MYAIRGVADGGIYRAKKKKGGGRGDAVGCIHMAKYQINLWKNEEW